MTPAVIDRAALPVGVQRLLSQAALEAGQSFDEYIYALLVNTASGIATKQVRDEKVSIRQERAAAAGMA